MKNELIFANREAAFKVAKLLLEECYIVMLSREEEFYVLNFEYSENCDRNDVVFMSIEDFEEKCFKEAAMLTEADKKQAYQHDYICELVAEVEELKAAQPHWVSVEDELPEPNIQCLVRDDHNNCAVGYYRRDVKAWDSPFFGWLERDDEYYEDGDLFRIGKVVAWMPIPEPPQKVQDADTK